MHRVAASSLALLLLAASACGGVAVATSSVILCRGTAYCPAGDSCMYASYASCGNPGVCLARPDGDACLEQVACGCSGNTETVCLMSGNSPSPIASLGSCDGATEQQGFDASTVVSSVDSSVADTSANVPPGGLRHPCLRRDERRYGGRCRGTMTLPPRAPTARRAGITATARAPRYNECTRSAAHARRRAPATRSARCHRRKGSARRASASTSATYGDQNCPYTNGSAFAPAARCSAYAATRAATPCADRGRAHEPLA